MSFMSAYLVLGGGAVLLAGLLIFGAGKRPTILTPGREDEPPVFWERVSLHCIIYPVWGVCFGLVFLRGIPVGAWDAHFPFEKNWPVVEPAEWFYSSVYWVPLIVPWLATNRGALRRYALGLWFLLAVSLAAFLLLPIISPPRSFVPTSLAGRLLAFDTSRGDFAAAACPSFHALWAMLCADFFASLGRGWAWAGWLWALAVIASCVATGAHALLDVVVSLALYPLLIWRHSPIWRRYYARADFLFSKKPTRNPPITPMANPPKP
jgi:hypothetical protein